MGQGQEEDDKEDEDEGREIRWLCKWAMMLWMSWLINLTGWADVPLAIDADMP